ncbi:MAG: OmpA family protein [Flavobacteriales bacterium]
MKKIFILSISFSLGFFQFVNAQFTQEKKISDNEKFTGKQFMNIKVAHAKSGELMPADIYINGLNPRRQVVFEDIIDTTFEINNYRLYTVSSIKKGYMYYCDKFWPDENQIHVQDITLKPLSVGLTTDVRDITFLGDQTAIYHKSESALKEIKLFLDLNPEISIAIIGHVNGPDNIKSRKFYQKASEERAQAVVESLIELGVDEEKLSVQGRGNTEMLYPDPQTDWQNEANRRVQILITAI